MVFPEEALTSFDADPLFVMQISKDLEHPLSPAVSEFHGALVRVEYPAQDFFALGPTPIPFGHLLFRHGFFLIRGVIVGSCKDPVNGMEDTAADMLAEGWRSLGNTDEGINEHINMGDQTRV